MFSATLHSPEVRSLAQVIPKFTCFTSTEVQILTPEVRSLAQSICQFPTWVDLKVLHLLALLEQKYKY